MQKETSLTSDVVIIGAGPTGLTLGNLLGRMGVAVALIERSPTTVQEPRAVSIDDESMRTMQAAGLAAEVEAITARGYGSDYKGPDGRIFASVKPVGREYGFEKRNAFQQPELESLLREGLLRFPNVITLFDHDAQNHQQDENGVIINCRQPNGEAFTVRGTYLVACDGGRSGTRSELGIELVGSTFEEPWLIVDLKQTFNRNRHTEVFCDPARPTISLPGPGGIRRYEFKLHKGESAAEVTRPDFVRRLLANVGPDQDAPIRRVQVYTFHARMASRWRRGRVFLAGDAAHLMPPFAGQGMNSGLRDAHNLAWKLAEALRCSDKPAQELILESYERERKDHARSMIGLALRMGQVMMPESRLQGVLVRTAFRLLGLYKPAREYFLHMKYKPKPRFVNGLIWPPAQSRLSGFVGAMLPQTVVEDTDRARTLMDNLLPDQPVVLVMHDRPESVVTPAMLETITSLGGFVAGLTPEGINASTACFPVFRDAGQLFSVPPYSDLIGCAVLLRRDRYVAAAAEVEDILELIKPLKALHPRPPIGSIHTDGGHTSETAEKKGEAATW